MLPEGHLEIYLDWDGTCIREVGIAPRRLADPARLLRGKTPEQAAATLPLLFSLCGKAQGAAAALVLDTARGIIMECGAARRAVLGEAFQELAWRFLLDLPQRFALAPDPPALAALRRDCASGLAGEELAQRLQTFLAHPLLDAAQRRLNEEGCWGEDDTAELPLFDAALAGEELLPALLAREDFAQLPLWRGKPAQTGAGAGSIAARFAARIAQMREIIAELSGACPAPEWRLGAAQAGENRAIAWVQTARGTLLHYARLEKGLVADYRIVAPTEWNFHPQGTYTQGLAGQTAATAEEARRRGELLLLALDPCVAYRLTVTHGRLLVLTEPS